MRLLFVVISFVVGLAGASAQMGLLAPPFKPWHSEGKNYWGIGILVDISDFPANSHVVSGTNVNFGISVAAGPEVAWASPSFKPSGYQGYNRFRLTSVVLKIGGTTVFSGSNGASVPFADGLTRNVRYASTHFNDGESVDIELDATAELTCEPDPNSSDAVPPPYNLVCPTLKIQNVMYNKGLTLATKEECYPKPHFVLDPMGQPVERPAGYYVDNPPLPDGYAQISQDAMPAARSALGTAKHTILNSSNFLSESELQPLLKQATCFFGFTHGETTNFRATQDNKLYFFGTPNEVQNYVQSGRTALPFNMVVMHACETVGGSGNLSWQAPAAFQLTAAQPSKIPNKAYAGFTAVVWSLTHKNFPLNEHAEVVYQQLVSGKTVKAAVDEANRKVIPQSKSGLPLLMIPKGDPYAKIVNVYLDSSEWTKERDSQWFVVFD